MCEPVTLCWPPWTCPVMDWPADGVEVSWDGRAPQPAMSKAMPPASRVSAPILQSLVSVGAVIRWSSCGESRGGRAQLSALGLRAYLVLRKSLGELLLKGCTTMGLGRPLIGVARSPSPVILRKV